MAYIQTDALCTLQVSPPIEEGRGIQPPSKKAKYKKHKIVQHSKNYDVFWQKIT